MREVEVLGPFIPSQLQSEAIEMEVRQHLPPCCAKERVSVRVPHDRAPDPHPDNLEWHQDGGGPLGTTAHMVVWASEQPTEIKLSDGSVFVAEPCELVWFDNCVVFHRQPHGTDEKRRWFMAVRCSGV